MADTAPKPTHDSTTMNSRDTGDTNDKQVAAKEKNEGFNMTTDSIIDAVEQKDTANGTARGNSVKHRLPSSSLEPGTKTNDISVESEQKSPETKAVAPSLEQSETQEPTDRLKRSRERNRVHARKTRQRKKEQMQTLQSRAEELKEEQVRLKQAINEKNTASILVGLFSTSGDKEVEKQSEDPLVEWLLRRPAEEIPDASKVTELPALILPGQHNSKKLKAPESIPQGLLPDDGIDYDLLGKNRSKCTPEELDQIRRERNRMHAKRTRDRKRLFMEEMADMCTKLEHENEVLLKHLESLGGSLPDLPKKSSQPTASEEDKAAAHENSNGATMDQLKTLLAAAGSFEPKNHVSPGIMSLSAVASSVATAVSNNPSSHSSDAEEHEGGEKSQTAPSPKRRRVGNKSNVPSMEIHSTNAVAV